MAENKIDNTGLTITSINDVLFNITASLKKIYGNDINLEQNSPDSQLMNIYAQATQDLKELLVRINNNFNPDTATGVILDQRVAINNIERRGATYTIQPIELTCDRTLTLQGLDANFNDLDGTGYTVADDEGNQFILVDTTTITAGTTALNFRAKDIGEVETTTGTITNQITIVLGITNVNNPSGALEIGQNEETDTELRVRRQQSVAIASNGYLNGLLASVLNLQGVSDAKLYENTTSVEDSDEIPSHSIWLIVEGGANTEIADLIYSKKSFGCGMKGAVSVNITTASGEVFVAKFDRPTAQNLHIRFDIQPTQTGASFDIAGIKQYIVDNLKYKIGQFAETSLITAVALQGIIAESGLVGVPVNVEISLNGSDWFDYLNPTTKDRQFTLTTGNITITEL